VRDQTVRPVHPDPALAHLPTGAAKQCKDLLFVDIDGYRHIFECEIEELPGEHPGQPHMQRLRPAEPGDEIFIGWWHNPPPPQPPPRQTIIFTRTPEED
jgi:proteasome lid subunit RPN8/RPN11